MDDTNTNKSKLLEAAKELFVSKGYNATSIREIAEKANLNSALIQYHFKGKQGLLVDIASDLFKGEIEYFIEALDGDLKSFEEFQFKLTFFLELYIVRALNKWTSLKIVINESYELSQIEHFQLSNNSEEHINNVEEFLLKAKKKKYINKDVDIRILADNLTCLALDQVLNWKVNILTRKHDISEKNVRKYWLTNTLNQIFAGVCPSK